MERNLVNIILKITLFMIQSIKKLLKYIRHGYPHGGKYILKYIIHLNGNMTYKMFINFLCMSLYNIKQIRDFLYKNIN